MRLSNLKTVVVVASLFSSLPAFGQNSVIDSLTGPVTTNEIGTFKTAIAGLVPGGSNNGNNYAYGNGGDAMEACGDMYDITRDRTILDKLVLYCDKVVSIRNTTRVMWTGNIDPVWPNSTNTQWGCEQGDVAGHLAYCAQLIAENPSIWNLSVGIGDTNGYGATYKARAATYLGVVDQTMDLFYANNFIHTNEYMQTPPSPPWPDPNSAGDSVPWNQQGMICSALARGADAHALFNDGSSRIAKFRNTAKASANRFIAQCRVFQYTVNGKTVAKWSYSGGTYSPGDTLHNVEDTAHGGYDISLMWRAYHWVNGGIATADGQMIADTFMEVIKTNAQFWSKVDGTGSLENGMKNSWTYLSEWRPDAFAATVKTGSQYYADAARKLWIKNAINTAWPTLANSTSTNGYFRIMARSSGKAANVQGASTADGAQVIQWDYTSDTNRNDEWQIVDIGGGYFKILNQNSGKAMNVEGVSTNDGAHVIQWTYSNNSSHNDEWQIIDIGGGYNKILNRNSGEALNVNGNGMTNGAILIQWPYSNDSKHNDEWQTISVP
jgi:hypothetical protein